MFTSVTDINAKKEAKTALTYLLISIFCVIFGAVYELYSHEVYSYFMIYAFVFPLVGGTLPFSILSLIHTRKYPCTLVRNLLHSGVATLTIGSFVRGILDIYGTTNQLSEYYWWLGGLFYISSLIICTIQFVFRIDENKY